MAQRSIHKRGRNLKGGDIVSKSLSRMGFGTSPVLSMEGDPTAKRGYCLVPGCGNWLEDLPKHGRCRTPECDARVQSLVKAENAGRVIDFEGTRWVISPETVMLTPAQKEPVVPKEYAEDDRFKRLNPDYNPQIEYCDSCSDRPKMPRRDLCPTCYQQSNITNRHNRRKKRELNSIKGLDRFTKKR